MVRTVLMFRQSLAAGLWATLVALVLVAMPAAAQQAPTQAQIDAFKSLPPEQQQALMTAGEGLADEFGRILTDANARSVKILEDKGTPVLTISDEDRARLAEAGKKYIDEWIQRADAAGLDGQTLVDDYTALIADFARQRDEQGYPWAGKTN